MSHVLIDEAQVHRIARLARLDLHEGEAGQLSVQLSHIVEYFQQLNALPTAQVEPLAHPLPIINVLRDDQPADSLPVASVLANAPQHVSGFFRVPRVLDQAGGA
ncbi:MAG: Glutamyl-tRNA(Gln) amidotransferase subunit C [Phycisphaerae bacterium]|nr:Glutamyl-tRNA(Gln) amidotransferase subunit C [Phycisphaerae bacterium]